MGNTKEPAMVRWPSLREKNTGLDGSKEERKRRKVQWDGLAGISIRKQGKGPERGPQSQNERWGKPNKSTQFL